MSTSAAEALRAQLDALSAERRVLQDNVAAMRQECTEKWVGGREGALGRCVGILTVLDCAIPVWRYDYMNR